MAITSSPLAQALGDQYVLQRELGHGGMATVYLAHDLKHDRLVALKVLRPELSYVLGRERFVQEVRIIARLQHPHILPLFDSGEAGTREAGGGQLWYTMPYVEGESLRQRLDREGQLSLDEALRISQNVLAALAYAHQHGIIHRDLKPENVLLESGEAVVADFGIAHAVDAAGGDRLTESGLALGTPTYMSPEQASGRSHVDRRSDIYGFGCVLYEMLAGEPPFTGTTPLAVFARHAVDPVPPLHTLRSTVPYELERAVVKALAKVPADRFATATEFATALATSLEAAPAGTDPTATVGSRAPRPVARKRLFGSMAALVALVIAGALTLPRWNRSPTAALDPKVVAVVPFRVTGADSSLRYLREGMLDLLATKLSGTENLRAVDPRTLLHAWRDAGGSAVSDLDRAAVTSLARRVGAGRLLEGEVIGTPQRVTLNARVSESAGGGEVRASIEGPSDSLTSLVDGLAAQLIVLGSGEPRHRIAALTTTSLPALRAYLDGRAAYHNGNFRTASELFDQAIELDSSFALAGLGRAMSGIWIGEPYDDAPGTLLAWRYRNRLSRRDLPLLQLMVGRRYPLLTSQSETFADAEALVAATSDSPEAWAILGDHTFHYGSQVGMSDALERSLRAYERAVSLDSTFVPAFEHLHELYYETGDRAAARQALILQLRADSTSQDAAVARWFARRLLGDTALGAISLTDDSLLVRARSVVRLALEYATGLADAESVLTLRGATVSNASERDELHDIRWTFYLARGQPKRAQAGMRLAATPADRTAAILAALYADADQRVAAKAVAQIPRVFARPTPQSSPQEILEQYAVAQHDLAYGRTKAARQAVRAWKGSWTPQDTSRVLRTASYHAMLLDAQLAALAHRPDALARLVELDSLLQTAPTSGRLEPVGNIIAAELWYRRGDFVRALASVRRREVGLWAPWGDVRCLYITSLRDEGRYAALVGNRAGAIRAYRHYLALRSTPEPAVRRKVEEVRAELAALERESTDR